jgi:periplasmic divalent cation tolerance protein
MVGRDDDTGFLVVLTTVESPEQGRTLVRRLVDQRVIACGTVLGGATSIYRWQGAVEEASETQVLLKTRRDRWTELQAAVTAAHPYDVPELLALPVAHGLGAYLDWLALEATGKGEASA